MPVLRLGLFRGPYSDRRSPPPQYYPRDPSPPPRRARSPPPQSPEPEREALSYRDRTPPPRDYAPPMKESIHRDRSPPREPQSSTFYSRSVGPAYDAELRAPPTGPSSSRYDNQIRDGPPTGPSYRGEPVPNYSRPSPSGPSSMPPSRPRNGNPAPYRDTYREFPSSRGGRPPGQATRRSPPSVPTGPRGSSTGISYEASTPSQPRWSTPSVPRWSDRSPAGPPSSGPPPPFRGSNNSTSTTYPRTQRFNTGPASHLSSIPPIIEGGKKLPSLMDSEHERKLAQIEDEKRRLEGMIEEKQRAKRAGLREWERLERESKRDALRSELAEGHLERLSGEVGGGGGGGY
ncbi:MAG: hypothetical protein LQ340_001555 [Diploschistes diacapsis]|nr:MAG: hypothetical protein LQ340_001555 [Diploschistes diacapsis]